MILISSSKRDDNNIDQYVNHTHNHNNLFMKLQFPPQTTEARGSTSVTPVDASSDVDSSDDLTVVHPGPSRTSRKKKRKSSDETEGLLE